MTSVTVNDALERTWFGTSLSPATRDRLAALGRLVELPEGTVILQEGTPCTSMGVVIDGRIAIRLGLPGTEDRTVLTVEPGDVFGFSALLSPAIATSTCIATTPSRAILFDGAELGAALDVDPELAAVVYKRLLMAVSRRLSATRTQLLDLYRAGNEPW